MNFTEFLLRLCGVKIENALHVAGARLVLRNGDAAGWVVLAALLILGGLYFAIVDSVAYGLRRLFMSEK